MIKTLICIVGPTASGKTAFAIDLALHFGTEIISADSRQFFKEMEIGTAKPTPEERSKVPHHFIDHVSITQSYDAGQFESEALNLMDQLFLVHDIVVLCGGSGLYIKALCEGFDDMPEVPSVIRENLNHQLESNGIAFLTEKLAQVDPEYYQKVDKNNPQRVIRALEVFEATGIPYSHFRKAEKKKRPFRTIKIGLEWPREEIYDRINTRMDAMVANGLVEEVKKLVPFKNLNALQTVGYTEVFGFLEGQYDWSECLRLLKQNSRRYAKRQMTWFKRDAEVVWFHPKEYPAVLQFIEKQLDK